MRNLAWIAGCVAPLVAAAPVAAQDYSATSVNNYEVGKLDLYGDAKGEIIDAPALPGGKALRVTVGGKGANAWDSGLVSKITGPVKAGEQFDFIFFARLVTGENGATTVSLPANNISLASPPYTPLASAPATLTSGWKRLRQQWIADKAYAPGTLQAGLQLAVGKNVIDFGPLYISKAGVAPPPVKRTVVEDLSSKIVNDPSKPESAGVKRELLKAGGPEGGDALRVKVVQQGKNNWDSNVETSIKKPIRKGDKLALMFDARLVEGPRGATTATIPNAAIQQKAEPYKSLGNGSPALTTQWQSFRYEGVADRDYGADEVKGTIQIGNAKQTIDFANIVVVNLGQ